MIISKKCVMLLVFVMPASVYGQGADNDTLTVKHNQEKSENYQFKWKQTVLPASLIAAGAICLPPGFLHNGSHSSTNEIRDLRGGNKRLVFDDYVQYLPVTCSLF